MTRWMPMLLLVAACAAQTRSTPTPQPTPQAPEPAGLEVQIVTSAEALGAVNSTLIVGEDEVVVVDAQFTATGAKQVIAAVHATGKPLTRLFITHGHPDHYLGSVRIREAFPEVEIIASPEVIADLEVAAKTAVPRVRGMLGPEFPGELVLPTAHRQDTLRVSGRTVKLLRNLNGDTHPITAVWVEDAGVLIGSDVVFSGVHAWTADGDAAARRSWRQELARLAELPGLAVVIPGHQVAGADRSPAVLAATADYLTAFDAASSESRDAAELTATMRERFPGLGGIQFLQIGAAAQHPSP